MTTVTPIKDRDEIPQAQPGHIEKIIQGVRDIQHAREYCEKAKAVSGYYLKKRERLYYFIKK
jgi:hypothetical protein